MNQASSFLVAFFLQKIGEFILLAAQWAIIDYVGARSDYYWSINFWNLHTPLQAAMRGVYAASAFFLFTLYPVITPIAIFLMRHFLAPLSPTALAATATFICVAFAWYILLIFAVPTNFAFFIITAIMAAFIYWSSMKLYPR
jgi:hypothetical protein